jgi:hypothetical protein
MGGIHFNPNAGGAQGPRETIAGHTFDARQSVVIRQCQKTLEGLVKDRNNAIEHRPDEALELHNMLQQFVNTDLEKSLKNCGLTPTEITDVLNHFEETIGYKGVPAGLVIPGPKDIPGLSHTQSLAVHRLEEALQNKYNDIKGRMDVSPSIQTEDQIYLENRDGFHDMVKPQVVGQLLAVWDEFNPAELKVAVRQLTMQWERLDYQLRYEVGRITVEDIRFK